MNLRMWQVPRNVKHRLFKLTPKIYVFLRFWTKLPLQTLKIVLEVCSWIMKAKAEKAQLREISPNIIKASKSISLWILPRRVLWAACVSFSVPACFALGPQMVPLMWTRPATLQGLWFRVVIVWSIIPPSIFLPFKSAYCSTFSLSFELEWNKSNESSGSLSLNGFTKP